MSEKHDAMWGADAGEYIAQQKAEIADLRSANKLLHGLIVNRDAEIARLRADSTLCIGKSVIEILARDGAWSSEDGRAAIAADDLFHADPYAEIARLRAALKAQLEAHNYAEVLEIARKALTPSHA